MLDYIINVAKVEDLQNISDIAELEKIFAKAKSTIVNGCSVFLVRKNGNGQNEKFDEFSTLADLEVYYNQVFKYL